MVKIYLPSSSNDSLLLYSENQSKSMLSVDHKAVRGDFHGDPLKDAASRGKLVSTYRVTHLAFGCHKVNAKVLGDSIPDILRSFSKPSQYSLILRLNCIEETVRMSNLMTAT